MTFDVFTDVTANLPAKMLENICLIPLDYTIADDRYTYVGNLEEFQVHEYYDRLRNGELAKTSLANTYAFKQQFEPSLQEGRDVICVTMSSGISGTYNAAKLAADELMSEYPDRVVYIIDSKGCGFGTGRLAVKAAELARNLTPVSEAEAILQEAVEHSCQYFTVNDLNFLRRTGRVHGVTAQLGTMLKINPILFGTSEGVIVVSKKLRGRAKALSALAEIFAAKHLEVQDTPVCISHGDCEDDAEELKAQILKLVPDTNIVIAPHEPISGSHVGPGMLGLFFTGDCR